MAMIPVADLQKNAQDLATKIGDQIAQLNQDLLGYRNIQIAVPQEVAWAGHSFLDAISAATQQLMASTPVDAVVKDPDVTEPTEPVLVDPVAPALIPVPQFAIAEPKIDLPSPPTLSVVAEPAAAPAPVGVALPDSPNYELPPLPVLSELQVPPPIAINIPHFDAVPPDIELTAPTNHFGYAETPYASALLDAIDAKLLSDLENGGYGIETVDEALLLDRAASREYETGERQLDAIVVGFAAKRYDLPPGALLEAQSRAREQMADAVNTLSREIAIKRYDLFVQARQFAIQQGIALENIRMSFYGAMMERFLNAAKYTADAAIAYFNAQVEAARLQQTMYEVEARVYDTLVHAEVEKLAVYNAQIEAEKLKGEIDHIKIEQYRAQVEAIHNNYELFNIRMRGVEVQQSVERLKIDGYRSTIDAFIARIHANELKLQQYEAAIRGEDAKERVYETQVRAFEGRVRGAETTANVARINVMNQVEINRGKLDLLNGRVNLYRAKLSGQIDTGRLHIDDVAAQWRGYEARSRAYEATSRLAIENYRANEDDFRIVLTHNLDKAKYELDLGRINRDWAGDTTKAVINDLGPMAQAALASVNTLGVQTAQES